MLKEVSIVQQICTSPEKFRHHPHDKTVAKLPYNSQLSAYKTLMSLHLVKSQFCSSDKTFLKVPEVV